MWRHMWRHAFAKIDFGHRLPFDVRRGSYLRENDGVYLWLSDTLASLLMFHQYCIDYAFECLCKLSLLYEVAV
jgi:hypothetical protein